MIPILLVPKRMELIKRLLLPSPRSLVFQMSKLVMTITGTGPVLAETKYPPPRHVVENATTGEGGSGKGGGR